MNKTIVFIISLLILMFGIKVAKICSFQSQTMVLSPEQGYFNAYIVIPVRATEVERYAAEELRTYIKRITGGEIAVVHETTNLENFGFYIGRTLQSKSYTLPVISPYEGANGFRIKAIPDGLVFIGGDDLSTLYAVYAFLEEYQGCGWFLPYELGEVVPRRDKILIPENIDVTQIPDFPMRWIGSGDWALRNRMNTGVQIHKHDVGVINKWQFHTHGILVDPKRYFDDHPEYFSLLDRATIEKYHGKKITGESCRFWGIVDNRSIHWQICTSEPEVVKLVTSHLVDVLTRNPSIEFISLAANDGYGFCQCSRCMNQMEPAQRNDRVGKETEPIFIFNNEVARRVKKFRPDQVIKVGAYANYLRFPFDPSYTPEDNLAIQITPNIQFCHNHAINDPSCPYNADFIQEFRKWVAAAKHVQIYGYNSLHGWAQLPWPMVHCLRRDLPEYHRIGAKLFFTQYWYLSLSYALNYHVAAKLAWNSSLNVDSLITESCKKMYGSAAQAMERYHRFLEDSWEKNPHHVGYYVEPVTLSMPKFYPPEVMIEAERLLHEAELVNADALSKKRVNLIRIDLDYLRLVLNYLESISEPFKEIDPKQNSIGWGNAINQAASIGEILSHNIKNYLKVNYPESIKRFWGSAVEGMLQTHKQPERIPGAQRGN